MLGLCRLVFPFVEDHKFYCEHWFTTRFFQKVKEFGALLARFGVIAEADDVFHLHHTEIDEALADLSLAWAAGSPPLGGPHFRPIIAERKRMLKVLEDWSPPPALGPVPEALNDPAVRMLWGITSERIAAWLNPDPDEVVGVAASAGMVEGIARVLHDVSEISSLREGEILVVPVTAPSWAPVFAKIAAAVSDIGGAMSHAAIVAREYGMPAVVGCGDATKRIRTGDRVRVDGDRGTVRVLEMSGPCSGGPGFAVALADARDAAVVGGKGASLGELARAGIAVPPGFVVTVDAFAAAMAAIDPSGALRAATVRARRRRPRRDRGRRRAVARPRRRRAAARRRLRGHRGRVREARRGAGSATEILIDTDVAVRSSATVEDSRDGVVRRTAGHLPGRGRAFRRCTITSAGAGRRSTTTSPSPTGAAWGCPRRASRWPSSCSGWSRRARPG